MSKRSNHFVKETIDPLGHVSRHIVVVVDIGKRNPEFELLRNFVGERGGGDTRDRERNNVQNRHGEEREKSRCESGEEEKIRVGSRSVTRGPVRL